MTSPKQAIEDFLQGQKDCSQGIPHKDGKSKNYDRGYSYEYWRQEQVAWRAQRHG